MLAATLGVPRAALLARLASSSAPVVVISGPTGSGKSTLARQWRAADPRPHVAVPLSPEADDAAGLARLLVEALDQVGPEAGRASPQITGDEPGFTTLTVPAVTRLATTRTGPYVLVLDDVSLVADPACHRLLRALAEAVPAGSQLMLLSRESTPAWLARSRSEGRLLELAAPDLAFSTDEAAQLFADMGVALDTAEVDRVVEQADGWAVALYLTALALRDRLRPPISAPPAGPRGSDRFILDYLRSELFDAIGRDTREFVLRSSVLDELRPELCDAVLGRDDSAAVLESLHTRLQLVVRVADPPRCFHLHRLLREAAQAELAATEPGAAASLHARASLWYERHGDLDAAVRHAGRAGDLTRVADLVWAGTAECVTSGRLDRLQRWLADLPEATIERERLLSLCSAMLAMQTGDAVGMTRWTLKAEAHAGAGWRRRVAHDGYAAALAVLRAVQGDDGLAEGERLCESALQGLPADSGYRAVAAFIRGVALTLRRDGSPGHQSLVEAERLGRALGVPIIAADALSWRGVLAVVGGDTPQGLRLISAATPIIEEHCLDRLATAGHCLTAQALAHALRHDACAPAALAKARATSVQTDPVAPWFAVTGRLVQARTAVLLGESGLARLLVREARERMTPDLADSLAGDFLDAAESSLRALAHEGVSAAALTAAELRVRAFLPTHLTFAQIGDRLYLSANTIKTHALSIYRKLGAGSRAEAVDHAHAIGLLEASHAS